MKEIENFINNSISFIKKKMGKDFIKIGTQQIFILVWIKYDFTPLQFYIVLFLFLTVYLKIFNLLSKCLKFFRSRRKLFKTNYNEIYF